MLDKKFKNKWIKALKGGKFTQGEGRLYKKDESGEKYCCLGVAGIICGIPKEMLYKSFLERYPLSYNIPKDIKGQKEVAAHLANMNDNGKSFEEIADYIKKNL